MKYINLLTQQWQIVSQNRSKTELCKIALKWPINHYLNMDDWVILNERKALYLSAVLTLAGIYIMLMKVPLKLANLPYTFFWMFWGLACLAAAAAYTDSLQRVKELPRIEYLRKKGIR